jgi:hypothetical protein
VATIKSQPDSARKEDWKDDKILGDYGNKAVLWSFCSKLMEK